MATGAGLGILPFWRWLAGFFILMGIGVGFAIGYVVRQSNVDDLQSAVVERDALLVGAEEEQARQQTRVEQLIGEQDGLTAKVTQLEADSGRLLERLDGLQRDLDAKAQEAGRLEGAEARVGELEQQLRGLREQGATSNIQPIRELAQRLEGDRLLLAEMRKDLPGGMTDARRFWATVKNLAVNSDPSLGPKVDKVTSALPAYYAWFEAEFASEQESDLTYALTGAINYEMSVDELWNAVLLVVIDRIDTLARLAAG